jgi:hypothetical protein
VANLIKVFERKKGIAEFHIQRQVQVANATLRLIVFMCSSLARIKFITIPIFGVILNVFWFLYLFLFQPLLPLNPLKGKWLKISTPGKH